MGSVKIAVISDLHLGTGDTSDLFGHDDAEFLRFLRFLESNFEKVVLLGDIWETLTSPVPFTPQHALRACKEGHPEIARRFERPGYVYVHGNHDIVLRELGAPDSWELQADGLRLHFTHGHTHDLLIRRARWLSELAVCVGAWLRRFGFRSIYKVLEHLEDWTTRGNVDPKLCSFRRWAIRHAAQREADVIVTGHTHLPALSEHGARMFLNSGTCSQGRTSFLAMDTQRGDYRVCDRW